GVFGRPQTPYKGHRAAISKGPSGAYPRGVRCGGHLVRKSDSRRSELPPGTPRLLRGYGPGGRKPPRADVESASGNPKSSRFGRNISCRSRLSRDVSQPIRVELARRGEGIQASTRAWPKLCESPRSLFSLPYEYGKNCRRSERT